MTPRERADDVWIRLQRNSGEARQIGIIRKAIEDAVEEERQTAKDTGVSYDELLESNLSERTKHEIFEWLWARRILDDDQYKLAMSRIEYIEKSKGD